MRTSVAPYLSEMPEERTEGTDRGNGRDDIVVRGDIILCACNRFLLKLIGFVFQVPFGIVVFDGIIVRQAFVGSVRL